MVHIAIAENYNSPESRFVVLSILLQTIFFYGRVEGFIFILLLCASQKYFLE